MIDRFYQFRLKWLFLAHILKGVKYCNNPLENKKGNCAF